MLTTDRLDIRNLTTDDLDILYEYRNDKECSKYQRWEDNSKLYIEYLIDKEKYKVFGVDTGNFAIVNKTSNVIVGDIFFSIKDKTITLGYTMSPQHQRKGYAFEILSEALLYIDKNFKDYETVALVDPLNEPSIKLLEKLEFVRDGYIEKLKSILYVKV